MTGTQFVPIIPGAIDDLGAEHELTAGALAMLLWLAVTVDRQTGDLYPVTVKAISEATRWSWRATKRSLDELEAIGAIEAHLPKGHDGHITLLWLDQIVWKKAARNRGSTRRNRASTHGNRGSTRRNRASAVANRENGDREREDRRSSSKIFSPVASGVGGSPDGAAAADGSGVKKKLALVNELADNLLSILVDLEDAPGVTNVQIWENWLDQVGYDRWEDENGNISHLPPNHQIEAVQSFADAAGAWLDGVGPPPYLVKQQLDRNSPSTEKGAKRWRGLCAVCLTTLPIKFSRRTHCPAADKAEDLLCEMCQLKMANRQILCPHCEPMSPMGDSDSGVSTATTVAIDSGLSMSPIGDITTSDAYQRGITKARAALTSTTDPL